MTQSPSPTADPSVRATDPSSLAPDPSATRFDYATVGHVTRDLIEYSSTSTAVQPGGSAFYSALQAARLGLRTVIVTQGVPTEIEELLAPFLNELTLHVIPAARTTTLSTRGRGTGRSQRMLAWAGPITEPIAIDTKILHFAPVARETPVSWQGTTGFVGITPQGLIRHWEERDEVPLVQLDAGSLLGDAPAAPAAGEAFPGELSRVDLDPTLLPANFDSAVISEQECPNCHVLFTAAAEYGARIAVTAGSLPTTIHVCDSGTGPRVAQTALPPVTEVRDDLGAGDVFAATFFVALNDGRTPLEAATLGNAAAALRIAGVGPGSIGRREEIESLAKDALAS